MLLFDHEGMLTLCSSHSDTPIIGPGEIYLLHQVTPENTIMPPTSRAGRQLGGEGQERCTIASSISLSSGLDMDCPLPSSYKEA